MKPQSKNLLALFAIILWACTALGILTRAQETPKAAIQPAQAPLNDESLRLMLDRAGYMPQRLSQGYAFTVKRGTWTFNIHVSLSPNGHKLGLNAINGSVDDPSSVPASTWLTLLETNADTEPSIFYFDKQSKKLFLHRNCDNRGITPEVLRGEIEAFCDDIQGTRPAWRFTK